MSRIRLTVLMIAGRLAVVLAALAWALLWAGPPQPAGAQDPSSDASVTSITVDGTRSVLSYGSTYTHGVSHSTSQVTVAATPTDSDASVSYSPPDVSGSTPGHQVRLGSAGSAGSRTSTVITVTAEDGTKEHHTLLINRSAGTAFGWKAVDDLTVLSLAGNTNPQGIWSDRTTMWVADFTDSKIYAYRMSDQARDSGKDFDTLDAAANEDPKDIWSNETTMWVVDSSDDKLYAYRMSDQARDGDKDFDSFRAEGHDAPSGIWSDGTTMWVSDSGNDKIYAYRMSDQARDEDEDFDTLQAAGNREPQGIWSDGTTMWVADTDDDKIYAYKMSDKTRDSGKDFDTLADAAEIRARGIWSDGDTMWVAQVNPVRSYGAVYSYDLPSFDADLSELEFKGGPVPGFNADTTSYTVAAETSLTGLFTVSAVPNDDAAEVTYSHKDLDSGTDGQQVGLCEGDNVVRATVSAEHRATQKTYEINVRVTGDAPNNSTSRAWLPVDEDGGPVYQCGGSMRATGEGEPRDIDWINVSLKAGQLYAIILKGEAFGDTDRSLDVPYVGGLLSMSVLQNGTTALGAPYFSHQDGWARVMFKPETDGDYQVVVAGLGDLGEHTGTYDLRVRPFKDDHFPNGTGSKTTVFDVSTDMDVEANSTISFPDDATEGDTFPSAAATGKIDYAFDSDWFRASGLEPGQKYLAEARDGESHLWITVHDASGRSQDVTWEGNRIVFQPEAAEDYYFRVYSPNRGNRAEYTLYIHPPLALDRGGTKDGPLTVAASGIFDPDGTRWATQYNRWRYEWFMDSDEQPILGAHQPSWLPTAAVAGEPIYARVCYLEDGEFRVRECRYSEVLTAITTSELDYDSFDAPFDLEAGARFRFLFVSSDKRTAQETEISAYDAWIQAQLRQDIIAGRSQEHADVFRALVSTAETSAIDHTGTDWTASEAGLPIYWLDTPFRVADSYADFWDGSRVPTDTRFTGFDFDSVDDPPEFSWGDSDFVWTGTSPDGSATAGSQLGASSAVVTQPTTGVVSSTTRPTTEQHYLYGLSEVFRIEVPENPYLLRVGGVAVSSTPRAAANTYGRGEQIEFTLTFSEAVKVTGNPQFRFGMTGRSPRQADYVSGSGTTQLIFRYTVQVTDHSNGIEWQPHTADDHPFLLDEDDRIADLTNMRDADFFSGRERLVDHQVAGRTLAYDSVVAPQNLEAGMQFRSLFVSTDKRTAQATEVSDYDEWIRAQLRKDIIDEQLREFADVVDALVSVGNFPAIQNTETSFTTSVPGPPIYWLDSTNLVADSYADFWGGSWSNRDVGSTGVDPSLRPDDDSLEPFIEFGASDYVWTGTASDGSREEGKELGTSNAAAARPHSGAGHEVYSADRPTTEEHYLYGLSRVLQIAEPQVPYLKRVGGVAVSSTPTAATDTYGVGEEIEFTLTFSEAVRVTGDPELLFSISGENWRWASYEGGSGTDELTFTYTVKAIDDSGSHGISVYPHYADVISVLLDSDDRIRDHSSNANDAVFFISGGTYTGHKVDGSLSNMQQGNQPATGAPVISGSPDVGALVTADLSSIADEDGLDNVSYAYQWLSGEDEITGATGSGYTLAESDFGRAVTVRVDFTDDAENAESLTSEAVWPVKTLTEGQSSNSPATGQPTITGTAQVGETLTASVTTIADEDGLDQVTYAYQWLAGETEVADATGSSHTLTRSQQGEQVTVRVSFTDDAGNAESLTSEPTAAVAAEPNTPATGQPSITGTALVGATLAVDTSGIADANGLSAVRFSYQWLSSDDGTDTEIAGATGATHQVAASDEGKPVKVRVGFTDDAGYAESLTSAALVPPRPTGLTATISDRAVVLSWNPPVGFPYLFRYRVLRQTPELGDDEPVASINTGGATASHTDSDVEPGVLYRYRVRASNFWNQFTVPSELVEIRTPQWTEAQNTPATGQPTISGTAQVGETLTAGTTGIADADGLENVSYAYQWLSGDAGIPGATGSSYALTDSEEGKTIKVKVSFTDDADNEETLTSQATAAVAAATVADPLVGFTLVDTSDQSEVATLTDGAAVTLEDPASGSYGIRVDLATDAEVGSVLLELSGAKTVSQTENTAPYSLYGDDGTDLNGESLPAGPYTLRAAAYSGDKLGGDLLQILEVSFTVAKTNTPATGSPTISGTLQVDETLTVDTSGTSDEDGLDNTTFEYQWLADNTEITGATSATYTLTDSEEGKAVTVRVDFTDDAGNEESLTSQATGAVAAAEPASPPPAPTALTAEVTEDGDIKLSWTAPDDDSVTGYQVLRRRPRLGEDTLEVYLEDTGSAGTTWTDTDAPAGTLYVYRVKAINAAGTGPQSNFVNVDHQP